jgi:hypothetical protein
MICPIADRPFFAILTDILQYATDKEAHFKIPGQDGCKIVVVTR